MNDKFIKTPRCNKSGIRINNSPPINEQEQFYNKIKTENKHTGIRIQTTDNNYKSDPFNGIDPFKNPNGDKPVKIQKTDTIDTLDLNINNYSKNELYKLFGIDDNASLTVDIMKICKKTVLKTHPDKSGMATKYFLFFSKAYKRLHSIYQFQNKGEGQISFQNNNFSDNQDKDNFEALNQMFDKNKSLRKTTNFNEWFNEQYEKNKLDDNDSGYGDWLKSNEDIEDISKISHKNLDSEIEKKKKHLQSITEYNGLSQQYFSSFGGSSIVQQNSDFTSSGLFSKEGMGFTDLKQAYVQSVIPVTEEDYNKIPKFSTIDEYNRYRNSVDMSIPTKEESMKQLYNQNKMDEDQNTALAYHLAKQSEEVSLKKQQFWSSIKQLKN
jgi:hypothetical protein